MPTSPTLTGLTHSSVGSWQNVCDFITVHIDDQFILMWKHLVFGLLERTVETIVIRFI